jgi:hypothetical protein
MRKSLLLLFLISSSCIVSGQVRLEFKGGASLSDQLVSNQGATVKGTYLIGFHAGMLFNFDATDEFSIQPGLFYSNKGYQYNQALSIGTRTAPQPVMGKVQINYMEAPVNAIYKLEITRTTNVYFGGGGYVGYGLSGTYVMQGQKTDIAFEKAIDGFQFKNPDYGVNGIVGSQISEHVLLEANYSLGLNNLSLYQGTTIHNRSMGLSIGYLF